jgi:hypothetical protein
VRIHWRDSAEWKSRHRDYFVDAPKDPSRE